MTLRDKALQSGLVFVDDENDLVPQWNTDDWPPLLGGWRAFLASVVLDHPEKYNAQTVVVLGGQKGNRRGDSTNSALVLNLDDENKQWQEGPPLNQSRQEHAAVVCNGGVYVIGGRASGDSWSHSIERIDVGDLLQSPSTNNTPRHWAQLNSRLSTAVGGRSCSAVSVCDRYIVVMAGISVQIIDTALQSNHAVIAGPSLTDDRQYCASAVVGTRIFDVGESIAYFDVQKPSDTDTNETACTVFPSSSAWTLHRSLVLSIRRSQHEAVSVGSCILVAGGCSGSAIVEVLDTERNIVWTLPHLSTGRNGCSIVVISDGIAVIGGFGVDSCATLPLIDRKEQLMNTFSCRSELDVHIEKAHTTIERAKVEYRDEEVLGQGAKAQLLLPILESLYDNEKFYSVQELREKIEELTDRMENMDAIQDRIPLVQKVKKLTSLLEQNGVAAEDKKIPGSKQGSHGGSEQCVPCADTFYKKVVDPEDINLQLHELSLLVSNLNQVKVFYTYLNHMRRCKNLSAEDWQRYSMNALQQACLNTPTNYSAATDFERIVSKFRKDGMFVNENIMRSIGINPMSSAPILMPNQETQSEPSEFRVGQILPLNALKAEETAEGFPVLMHVQALGRSLKELCSAVEARDDNHVAVAVICSILNALSFGRSTRSHNDSKQPYVNTVLDQIVDYCDVDHICSVLDQSGNETLHKVYQEGVAYVDRARTTAKNDDKSMEENDGTQLLVAVMGGLANGITKLAGTTTRYEGDMDVENLESVTFLALIVTAKMVQLVEPAVQLEVSNVSNVDNPETDVSNTGGRRQTNGPSAELSPSGVVSANSAGSIGMGESEKDVKKAFGQSPPTTNVSPSECGPSTVIAVSRSSGRSLGDHAMTLQERMSALEESVATIVEEIKISNRHHAKLVEMLEKFDNHQS